MKTMVLVAFFFNRLQIWKGGWQLLDERWKIGKEIESFFLLTKDFGRCFAFVFGELHWSCFPFSKPQLNFESSIYSWPNKKFMFYTDWAHTKILLMSVTKHNKSAQKFHYNCSKVVSYSSLTIKKIPVEYRFGGAMKKIDEVARTHLNQVPTPRYSSCSFMLQSERRWSFFSSALFLCFPNGAQSSHEFANTA